MKFKHLIPRSKLSPVFLLLVSNILFSVSWKHELYRNSQGFVFSLYLFLAYISILFIHVRLGCILVSALLSSVFVYDNWQKLMLLTDRNCGCHMRS